MRNNGTMRAHIRSRIGLENNWCSRFRWMLAARAAQIQEAFCACDFGSHCRKRLRCFCNSCRSVCNSCGCFCKSCPRALGILSIVIVVVVMEDEVLFLRWLLLFHLRLIEERPIDVLASCSLRKALVPLRMSIGGAKLSL